MNICNCADPVSWVPGILGNILGSGEDRTLNTFISEIRKTSTSSAVGWRNLITSWGKYGNTYWFALDWENKETAKLQLNAHRQEVYLEYLSRLESENSFKGWADASFKQFVTVMSNKMTISSVWCPVDVEVTDSSGKFLASVVGDNVTYGDGVDIGDIVVLTMDDRKAFLVNGYDNYTVSLKGTGDGELTYIYSQVDLGEQTLNGGDVYEHVPLTADKTYVSTISLDDISDTKLYETDASGSVVAELGNDGSVIDTSVDSVTSSDDDDPLFSFSKWKENVGWDVSDAQLRAMSVVIAIFVIIVIFIGLTMM